ncbi:MAG: hypothetical protein ACOZHQ_17065 [Thermodesulfobacteriota bacterium]
MSITVKYLGLRDQPILVTPTGRFPAAPPPSPTPNLSASSLYFSGGGAELPLGLRQAEQERVLAQVRLRVDALAAAIDRLPLPAGDLPQTEVTATSDQPQALTATADAGAAAPASHGVQVQWPAAPGSVFSTPQNPIALTDLDDGEHVFKLVIDGVEHALTLTVNNGDGGPPDSQEEILGRLARVISGVDPRIRAEVEPAQADFRDLGERHRRLGRAVRLKIETVGAAQGPDFRLEDVSGSLVSAYGLNSGIPGRPARLGLMGALADSADGAASLDRGQVAVQALAASDGVATVAVEQGAGPLLRSLGALINQYNDLMGYLDLHADLLRPSLKDRVTRPLEERARVLGEIGLRATPQGRLKALSGFADQVARNYPAVRERLTGESGWTQGLRQKLVQIQALEPDAFAADLTAPSHLEQLKRVWRAMDAVRTGLVGGYY